MEESCSFPCLSVTPQNIPSQHRMMGVARKSKPTSGSIRPLETAAGIPAGNLNNSCWNPTHSETCDRESTCYTALTLLMKTYTVHTAQC